MSGGVRASSEGTIGERFTPPGLSRHPDFLKLWTGETVSAAGSEVTVLALPTLAVLQLHVTPLQVGLLVACSRVPFPFLALFAGALVDRISRRPIMIMADIGRAAVLGTIPLSASVGALRIWQLYAVALISGALTVFFDVAYLAYLPDIVQREHLIDANARLQLSSSAASTAGPGLAGILIQILTAAGAIGVDAATYLISAAALLLVRTRRALQQLESDERGHILREIGEGVTLVARHPLLRSLIVTFGLFILGAHVVEGVEVPFAYRSLHLSPLTFGVVLLCGGIGAVCGALLARPAVRYVGLGRSLAIGNLVAGFMFLVIPLGLILPPPGVLIAAYTILGAANTVANINQFTLRQVITPGRLQGRMSATFRTVYWGAWPLGNVLGGLGGAIFGTAQTILAGGALAVAASLAILATPLAELRIFPDADK